MTNATNNTNTIRDLTNAEWAAAFGRDAETMNELPIDTNVGDMCAKLITHVEGMRALGMEPDDHREIVRRAANTMIVWYFG